MKRRCLTDGNKRMFVLGLIPAAGQTWAESAVNIQHLNFDPESRSPIMTLFHGGQS
ncbi:MAG: hypothetical protein LAO22_23485 [Acidobacteriia bacterium]|nr:hypothetical protein [Terriglobia bacterium]